MKLTFKNRLKICFEVMTVKSGHNNTAQEKILSTFQKGYSYGIYDAGFEIKRLRDGIKQCLEENSHLADGDVCTLKQLKDLIA